MVLRFQTFANLVHSRVHLKYLENVGELQVIPPISGEIAADFLVGFATLPRVTALTNMDWAGTAAAESHLVTGWQDTIKE